MPGLRISASPLPIVLAGVVTGAVAWIPVVWVLAPSATAPQTPAANPPFKAAFVPQATAVDSDSAPILPPELLPHGLAGGGLPIERAEIRDIPPAGQEFSASQGVRPASFGPLPNTPDGRPVAVEAAADSFEELNADPMESPNSLRLGEEGQLRPIVRPESGRVTIRDPAKEIPPDGLSAPSANRLSVDETDTLRLMHELHSEKNSTRDAAASELARRGFNEAHLDLARQLTSAKPEVRAAVASRLPVTPGIDARVWLTWLIRDESADVRLAAIGVLATTGQSEALRRALEIARQDRDPRIRKLLGQIEKPQR